MLSSAEEIDVHSNSGFVLRLLGHPSRVSGPGVERAFSRSSHRSAFSSGSSVCDGRARLLAVERRRLEERGIPIFESRVERLAGRRSGLEIVFRDGNRLARRALFPSTGQDMSSDMPRRLGCRFNGKGTFRTDRLEGTGVPGLYVAGDASYDVRFAIVAAAEGAKAAVAINRSLQEQEALSVPARGGKARRDERRLRR